MHTQSRQTLQEPASYRWLENGHILLWLIKDTCWCMVWRPGGLIMILPTWSMAIFLTWRARKDRSELFHNVAICLWILANSVWMVGEFFEWDKHTKPVAVGIFLTGLCFLLIYYIFFFWKDMKKSSLNVE